MADDFWILSAKSDFYPHLADRRTLCHSLVVMTFICLWRWYWINHTTSLSTNSFVRLDQNVGNEFSADVWQSLGIFSKVLTGVKPIQPRPGSHPDVWLSRLIQFSGIHLLSKLLQVPTRFLFIRTIIYKNNEPRCWAEIKNILRTVRASDSNNKTRTKIKN